MQTHATSLPMHRLFLAFDESSISYVASAIDLSIATKQLNIPVVGGNTHAIIGPRNRSAIHNDDDMLRSVSVEATEDENAVLRIIALNPLESV